MPLEARFAYDPEANVFFLNLEGMFVTTVEQAQTITAEIDKRLAAVGKKVRLVANYDNFSLHRSCTTRISPRSAAWPPATTRTSLVTTTRAFMRLNLGAMLSTRGVASHIYESRHEAMNWLRKPPE